MQSDERFERVAEELAVMELAVMADIRSDGSVRSHRSLGSAMPITVISINRSEFI